MAALAQKLKARLTISRKGRITIQATWAFGSLTVTACPGRKKTGEGCTAAEVLGAGIQVNFRM